MRTQNPQVMGQVGDTQCPGTTREEDPEVGPHQTGLKPTWPTNFSARLSGHQKWKDSAQHSPKVTA